MLRIKEVVQIKLNLKFEIMGNESYFEWLWTRKGYVASIVAAFIVLIVYVFNINAMIAASSWQVTTIVGIIPLIATYALILNTIKLWKK